MFENTAPFDVTHHPALSLPCGSNNGLPIGLMLVGRHFDESSIYRAASAYEQLIMSNRSGPPNGSPAGKPNDNQRFAV